MLLVVSKQSSTLFPNFAERKNMYFGATAILIVFGPRLLPLGLCRSLYESSSICMTLRFQVWIVVVLSSIWFPRAKRYTQSHYTHLVVIKVFNSSLSGPRWPWIAQDKKHKNFNGTLLYRELLEINQLKFQWNGNIFEEIPYQVLHKIIIFFPYFAQPNLIEMWLFLFLLNFSPTHVLNLELYET